MSNERILAQLQKNLQSYRDRKESLEHRLIHMEEQLKSATKLVAETEEAIAALEGRTTETRRMLEEALKLQTAKSGYGPITPALPSSAPNANNDLLWHNGVMAEPGFHWENGNLVPDAVPTTGSYDEKVYVELPPVDDNFEPIDPMGFNPKY